MTTEKTYNEKLLDMSLSELREQYKYATDGQKGTQSDFFYWSWQAQIDAIDNAKRLLMQKQVEVICGEYGIERVVRYAKKLYDIQQKRKEVEELEKKL